MCSVLKRHIFAPTASCTCALWIHLQTIGRQLCAMYTWCAAYWHDNQHCACRMRSAGFGLKYCSSMAAIFDCMSDAAGCAIKSRKCYFGVSECSYMLVAASSTQQSVLYVMLLCGMLTLWSKPMSPVTSKSMFNQSADQNTSKANP